jgi:hypothetical protein
LYKAGREDMKNIKSMPKRFNKLYTIAAGLAASTSIPIGITEIDQLEYAPFNTVLIVNTASQLVSFVPNGDTGKKVPITSSWAFDDANFTHAQILNEDAAAATSGAVYVLVMNTVNFRTLLNGMSEVLEDLMVKK